MDCSLLKKLGGYSYLDNPIYNAQLSQFELTKSDVDVVFAGDSITANCHFDELLDTDLSLLNRGIGSDTTEGLYNRCDEIINHKPETVFIMIGINDVGKDISSEETERYYKLTINTILTQLPECRIVLQSILPTLTDDGINECVVTTNQMISSIAEEYDLEFIDIYSSFMDGDTVNKELFSADLVHLNRNGYKIWMDILRNHLQ